MKVKMIDVAKKLGLSKAAVSLALNNKPGVSAETRQRVQDCMKELEEQYSGLCGEHRPEKIIQIELLTHNEEVSSKMEMDLWSDVIQAFEKEAKVYNYRIGFTTVYEDAMSRKDALDECNMPTVAGVILFGTDMRASDRSFVKKIQKPVVIYDYVMPEGDYTCICIDSRRTLEIAVDELLRAGVKKTAYLATTKNMFNFAERRNEFMHVMFDRGVPVEKSDIIHMGSVISENIEAAERFLRTNDTYDGLIMENYQVSSGVLKAIERIGTEKFKKLRMVGIDEISETFEGEFKLTQIKIPHKDRALMAIQLLKREIDGRGSTKMRVYAIPTLIKGETT